MLLFSVRRVQLDREELTILVMIGSSFTRLHGTDDEANDKPFSFKGAWTFNNFLKFYDSVMTFQIHSNVLA